MDIHQHEEVRRIFRKELYQLKQNGFLDQADYEKVANAHNHYMLSLAAQEDGSKIPAGVPAEEKARPVGKKKQQPAKPKLTKEQLRERNISWLLNLGVILLLIGGLFVGTSNWESMSDTMKAVCIALVSLLFYGISYIASRVLKIEKTAFAFTVLGSLFLPIFILSLGWFRLLGDYLSFDGEGRYVLGAIGGGLLFPVYGSTARMLGSRLFVWFAYVSLTAGAAFTLRALGFGSDAFYFGIMAYNGGLVTVYHFLRKQGRLPLFTKELAAYSQVNLVLSTFFTLFLFENVVWNGFNLILTAYIYLSMIYVSGKKEYHFIFTTMLVYGAYQIFEHWPYGSLSPVGFALLGFVFLLLPRFLGSELGLERIFRFTSGAVSSFAFLYISLEAMLMRSGTGSFFLLAAYILIAANFLYLGNADPNRLFRYLSPFFFGVALFETVRILDTYIVFGSYALPVFLIGMLLFLLFGWVLRHKWMEVIRQSSRDVGLGGMVLALLLGISEFAWWELGVMLLLLAVLFHLMLRIEDRKFILITIPWLIPASLCFAFLYFGEELLQASAYYQAQLGVAFHFTATGLIMVAGAWMYKKYKMDLLMRNMLLFGEGMYAFGLLLSLALPIDEMWVRPGLWVLGILLFYLFYRVTGYKWLVYVLPAACLLAYFVVQTPLHQKFEFTRVMDAILLAGGGVVLLLASLSLNKKDPVLASGFAWIGHGYLSPVVLLILFAFGEQSFWVLLLVLSVYAGSYRMPAASWKKSYFLYGSFTVLFLALEAGIQLFVPGGRFQYAFLAASILIGLFWLLSREEERKRAFYYFVPFSMIGLSSFLAVYPFEWSTYLFMAAYAAGIILLLVQAKGENLVFLPIIVVFAGSMEYIYFSSMETVWALLLLSGIGLGLLSAGASRFKTLFTSAKQLDGYTLGAFFFIAAIYGFEWETFWAGVLHGLMMSGALWLQRGRVPAAAKVWVTFAAGAYLLLPYYTLASQLDVHPLWQQEVLVLPWVALTIYLKAVTSGRWKRQTNIIQWGVLLLAAMLLVLDGLSSSTVYDALILGSLSLFSVLTGMWLRIKAYFFVGSGVLLLNVLLQTRSFWGNLPWWGYLLGAGTLLISVASFNEWNKQKGAKGEKTYLARMGEKLLAKLKQWD
jgi:hypothetical protein